MTAFLCIREVGKENVLEVLDRVVTFHCRVYRIHKGFINIVYQQAQYILLALKMAVNRPFRSTDTNRYFTDSNVFDSFGGNNVPKGIY